MEMFTKMKNVIKTEISSVRSDMSHLLRRVEEMEETADSQVKEIQDLKEQMKKMQHDNRVLIYKLEEQENQSRRQNLRIRDLPEQQNEDLRNKLQKLFNPILGRREDEVLRIDRVHRIRKPPNMRQDIPRDVIVKFHAYEDKEKIRTNLRGAPLSYDNKELKIFADLSAGTLARRSQLKPLLDQLKRSNLKYSWGFPTSLLVTKEGRTFKMRYPEEMRDFCGNLGIIPPEALM